MVVGFNGRWPKMKIEAREWLACGLAEARPAGCGQIIGRSKIELAGARAA